MSYSVATEPEKDSSMADSDEDYIDRRKAGRDKFKSERREYENRSGFSGGSGGGSGGRADKRDYYDERLPTRMDYGSGRRGGSGGPFRGDRYSSSAGVGQSDVPPFKRPRRDMEEGTHGGIYLRKRYFSYCVGINLPKVTRSRCSFLISWLP